MVLFLYVLLGRLILNVRGWRLTVLRRYQGMFVISLILILRGLGRMGMRILILMLKGIRIKVLEIFRK